MHRLIKQILPNPSFFSMIILLAIPLFFAGCSENQNSDTSGTLNPDGNFVAPIPLSMQKHQSSGKVFTVKLIIDTNPPIDMVINQDTGQMTATVEGLTPGTHTFLIEYYLDNVKSATAKKEVEIVAKLNTVINFDAASIVREIPIVNVTNPLDGASVPDLETPLSAAFNLHLDPLSINTSTFTLESASGPVTGSVSYTESPDFSATFTPLTKLAPSTEYTATLSTEVSSLLGAPLRVDHQWRFTTRDRRWSGESKISRDRRSMDDLQMKIDSNGSAIAVWTARNDTALSVYASRFSGATWDAESKMISRDRIPNFIFSLQLEIDSNGQTFAVWKENNDTTWSVYANRFSELTWGSEVKISGDFGGFNSTTSSVQMRIDSNGNVIVVWQEETAGGWSIHANRFSVNTATWGSEAKISGDFTSPGDFQIEIDSNENVIVVWEEGIAGAWSIHANRFSINTATWGSEVEISEGSDPTRGLQMVIDSNGNATAVWHRRKDGFWSIHANRFVADITAWGSEVKISGDVPSPIGLQVEIDSIGNVIAAWIESTPQAGSIYSNRFSADAAAWGTESKISEDFIISGDLKVEIDLDGNVIAIWEEKEGSSWSVHANQFVADTAAWGNESKISGDLTSVFGGDLQVNIDSNRNVIAVWREETDGSQSVHSNRLAADNTVWDSASKISGDLASTSVVGLQMVLDFNGNAFAVWREENDSIWSVHANRLLAKTSDWDSESKISKDFIDQHGNLFGSDLKIKLDPNGNAIVAWQEKNEESASLHTNIFQ